MLNDLAFLQPYSFEQVGSSFRQGVYPGLLHMAALAQGKKADAAWRKATMPFFLFLSQPDFEFKCLEESYRPAMTPSTTRI